MAQYRKGDFNNARKNFKAAQDAGFKPGAFEDTPAQMLADMDLKEKATTQQTAKQAQETARQAQEAQAAQAKKDQERSVASRQAAAKASYETAKQQYRKGDWIAARQSFMAAQAAGYKPGLFEDPPATYLKRMDQKETADAQKARDEMARAAAKGRRCQGSRAGEGRPASACRRGARRGGPGRAREIRYLRRCGRR